MNGVGFRTNIGIANRFVKAPENVRYKNPSSFLISHLNAAQNPFIIKALKAWSHFPILSPVDIDARIIYHNSIEASSAGCTTDTLLSQTAVDQMCSKCLNNCIHVPTLLASPVHHKILQYNNSLDSPTFLLPKHIDRWWCALRNPHGPATYLYSCLFATGSVLQSDSFQW